MKIYIVRHGQTNSNKDRKSAGQRVDDLLNIDGIEQIKKLSEEIETDFDVIFSSTMKRAKQSAKIIAEKIGVPIVERAEIMERDYGKLSGFLWDDFKRILKDEGVDWEKEKNGQYYDFRPYDGEHADDVKKRLLEFINELKADYFGKKILVVTHGGILKMIYFLFGKGEAKRLENASIHEFEV